MKKRFAAHQLIISANCRLKQYVVEMEGKIVSRIFPLTEEIAFTEWIGGMIILSADNEKIKHMQLPTKLESVLMLLADNSIQEKGVIEENQQLCAWHISAEDVSAGIVHAMRQL